MPIANQDYISQEDCSKQGNKSDSYSQNGKHGIGHMRGGEIKDNAKIIGQSVENTSDRSQKINNQITINNSSIAERNTVNNQKRIKASVKKNDIEYSAEAPTVDELIECFKSLKELFDVKVKDIEQGSIKFILKGSEQKLKNIAELFESGELVPFLKQKFNLKLEGAKLIDSDSSELSKKNQSQKLLAFTIAGNVSQADIDILKAALINTSDNDEEIKKEKKSNLVEEIISKGAKGRDLRGINLRDTSLMYAKLNDTNLSGADLSEACLSGANLIHSNLSGANLRDTLLINADLSGANLRDADLRNANFRGALLIHAELKNADLSRAKLSGANLSGADLSRAKLSGANLSGADLRDTDLRNADLSRAKRNQLLTYTNLSGANLSGANLSGANLSSAFLIRADLSNTELENANVNNTIFRDNQGISDQLKQNLIERGAKFDEPPQGKESKNFTRF